MNRVSRKRKQVKYEIAERDTECRKCRCGLVWGVNTQMHEGIFSRKQIYPFSDAVKIEYFYNEYNCVLLCRHCNLNDAPPPQEIFDQQVEIYGQEFLDWYEKARAQFKSPPGRLDA